MLTQRVASTHLWPGKQVVSQWPGLGIPGAQIPTTGDYGGSPLANDGIVADNEYRIEVTTPPSAGTQTFYPDTSFEFTAPDGVYSFTYEGFENGFSYGSVTDPLTVGTIATSTITASLGPAVFAGASFVSPICALSSLLDAITFSGASYASPVSAISASIGPAVFVGGSSVSGVSAAAINAQIGPLSASFAAYSAPHGAVSATIAPIVSSCGSYSSAQAVIHADIGPIVFIGSSEAAGSGRGFFNATLAGFVVNASAVSAPVSAISATLPPITFSGYSQSGAGIQPGPSSYRVRSLIRTWRVNTRKRSWTAKSNSKGLIMPLPIKDPEEIKTVTFDFTGDAATIAAAEVTATSSGGLRDATPANVLGAEQTIDGALVYRRIKLGQPGSTYTLRCKATDADGEVHIVSAYLPVAVQVPQ